MACWSQLESKNVNYVPIVGMVRNDNALRKHGFAYVADAIKENLEK